MEVNPPPVDEEKVDDNGLPSLSTKDRMIYLYYYWNLLLCTVLNWIEEGVTIRLQEQLPVHHEQQHYFAP